MALIELKDYVLKPEKTGKSKGIGPATLNLEKGKVYSVATDSANDAHLFFKGLATLAYPSSGTYRFNGSTLDFSDYRKLLSTKRRIGYLTSETALISNRSIMDNLNVSKVYFENDLSSTLDEDTMELCRTFGIESVLYLRPANLGAPDNKCAMIVRELSKKPEILLLEYPEEFCLSEGNTLEILIEILKKKIGQGMSLVFLTYEEDFSRCFESRIIEIARGQLKKTWET
jgi:ABC-type polar amino acid transport system ATPase subunit